MKKVLCALLVVALIIPFAYAEEIKEDFGFALLEALYDGESNQLISPVSLACALGMAAQGAEGETKQEILGLLELDDLSKLEELSRKLGESGLKQANAAFLAGEMTPKESYVSDLKEMFGAEWFENDGGVAEKINAWVQEHTDGMIDKMLDGELDENTALVLVNALAMDAKWMAEFDPENTFDDVFHTPDGEAMVPFMHKTFHAAYGEREGVQLLKLQYRDDDFAPNGLAMLIALPGEGGVEDVLADLKAEGTGYFSFGAEPVKVELSMPKMDISADNSLTDVLKTLGVQTAFSDTADFSGIADEPLRIGSVLQKTRLTADEEGTKAAAATAVSMVAMAMPMPEEIVEFNMNRPFVMAVVHEESGAVCFAGVVTNPTAN